MQHINYLPSIGYFQHALQQGSTLELALADRYQRQSFRNRCEIAGPNAKLVLSIPTKKLPAERSFKNVEISYAENWQKQHWRSFESAYRRSAYFEYYEDEISAFYSQERFQFLWEFNHELLKTLIRLLKLNIETVIEAELPIQGENLYPLLKVKQYFQVFSDRQPFLENLSIVDLLFAKGPQSLEILKIN